MRTTLPFLLFLLSCGPQLEPADPSGSEMSAVEEPQVAPPARLWASLAVQPKVTGFPCNVRQVFQANCAGCHAGAVYIPGFSSREDFAFRSADGTTFGDLAVQRMASTQQPMPPDGVAAQPSAEDKALISAWVGAGMPGGECGELTPP